MQFCSLIMDVNTYEKSQLKFSLTGILGIHRTQKWISRTISKRAHRISKIAFCLCSYESLDSMERCIKNGFFYWHSNLWKGSVVHSRWSPKQLYWSEFCSHSWKIRCSIAFSRKKAEKQRTLLVRFPLSFLVGTADKHRILLTLCAEFWPDWQLKFIGHFHGQYFNRVSFSIFVLACTYFIFQFSKMYYWPSTL